MEVTGAAKNAGYGVHLSVTGGLTRAGAFVEMELGFCSLVPRQTNVLRLVEEGAVAAGCVCPAVFDQAQSGSHWQT